MNNINTWLYSTIYVLPLTQWNNEPVVVNLFHVSAIIGYKANDATVIIWGYSLEVKKDQLYSHFVAVYQRLGQRDDDTQAGTGTRVDPDGVPF